MLRLVVWGALAAVGCGRFAFELVPAGDGGGDAPVPTCVGHDEDGDGFPIVVDFEHLVIYAVH
jgi:hypothetical protein